MVIDREPKAVRRALSVTAAERCPAPRPLLPGGGLLRQDDGVGGGFEGVEGLLEEIYLPVEPLGETERDVRTFDRGCLIPCSVIRSNTPACALGKIPANEDLWVQMRTNAYIPAGIFNNAGKG